MKISRNKIVEISQDEAVEIIKDNGRKQTVGVVHTKKMEYSEQALTE